MEHDCSCIAPHVTAYCVVLGHAGLRAIAWATLVLHRNLLWSPTLHSPVPH